MDTFPIYFLIFSESLILFFITFFSVIPKLESLTVMQSKKSECLNETIEFKKVNPLPNCTTSLDVSILCELLSKLKVLFYKVWLGEYCKIKNTHFDNCMTHLSV